MLGVLLLAAAMAPAPQPSPTPLKTITHVHSSPFCTAFGENIKHGVQGLLLNDDLFKRTEPVFLKAAHDMVTGGMHSNFNSLHPAQADADNAAVSLDMARMEEIEGAVVHNLQTINDVLNDSSRFPKQPKTEDDRQLVQLRARLLAVAKQQNSELNVLSGTSEQYLFDALYNAPMGNIPAASGDLPGKVAYLAGGPLNAPPNPQGQAQQSLTQGKGASNQIQLGQNVQTISGDPRLLENDIFMNSEMGRMYKELLVTEAHESAMETPFAQALTEASAGCK